MKRGGLWRIAAMLLVLALVTSPASLSKAKYVSEDISSSNEIKVYHLLSGVTITGTGTYYFPPGKVAFYCRGQAGTKGADSNQWGHDMKGGAGGAPGIIKGVLTDFPGGYFTVGECNAGSGRDTGRGGGKGKWIVLNRAAPSTTAKDVSGLVAVAGGGGGGTGAYAGMFQWLHGNDGGNAGAYDGSVNGGSGGNAGVYRGWSGAAYGGGGTALLGPYRQTGDLVVNGGGGGDISAGTDSGGGYGGTLDNSGVGGSWFGGGNGNQNSGGSGGGGGGLYGGGGGGRHGGNRSDGSGGGGSSYVTSSSAVPGSYANPTSYYECAVNYFNKLVSDKGSTDLAAVIVWLGP